MSAIQFWPCCGATAAASVTGGDGLLDNEHERCNFDLFRSLKSILVTPLRRYVLLDAAAVVSQIWGTFYCSSIGNNYANNSHNAN